MENIKTIKREWATKYRFKEKLYNLMFGKKCPNCKDGRLGIIMFDRVKCPMCRHEVKKCIKSK